VRIKVVSCTRLIMIGTRNQQVTRPMVRQTTPAMRWIAVQMLFTGLS